MNSVTYFWLRQGWLGMGSDGEYEVILVVVNGTVELPFWCFGVTLIFFAWLLVHF